MSIGPMQRNTNKTRSNCVIGGAKVGRARSRINPNATIKSGFNFFTLWIHWFSGLSRPDGWKRLSSPNNRPEEGIWGRITTPRWLEKKALLQQTTRGRITTHTWLEKDSLQLTTDQNKAYGEGLPRPDAWKKIFFS